MTNWKYYLYLADLFQDFYEKDDDDLTEDDIGVVVKSTHERLLLLKEEILKKEDDPDYMLGGLSGLDFIIDDFHYFDHSQFYDDQMHEFDRMMDDLYDFADYHYVWINTSDRSLNGIGKP